MLGVWVGLVVKLGFWAGVKSVGLELGGTVQDTQTGRRRRVQVYFHVQVARFFGPQGHHCLPASWDHFIPSLRQNAEMAGKPRNCLLGMAQVLPVFHTDLSLTIAAEPISGTEICLASESFAPLSSWRLWYWDLDVLGPFNSQTQVLQQNAFRRIAGSLGGDLPGAMQLWPNSCVSSPRLRPIKSAVVVFDGTASSRRQLLLLFLNVGWFGCLNGFWGRTWKVAE
jgi:hypothetical protein